MARLTFQVVLSLTVLCVAAAMPINAEEPGVAVFQNPICPPGPSTAGQYPVPHGGLSLPALSEMESLPDAPPSPNHPSGNSPQSSGMSPSDDGLPQPEFDTLPSNMLAPNMAMPTFMPTTAATSAEPVAPNMMGDLFGTQFSGAVPIVIDNLFASGGLTDVGGAPDFDITSPVVYSATDMTHS